MQATQRNGRLFVEPTEPDDHQTELLKSSFPDYVREGLLKRTQWNEARVLGFQRMSLFCHLDREILEAAKEGKLSRALVAEVRKERNLHARYLMSKVLANKARGSLDFLLSNDR